MPLKKISVKTFGMETIVYVKSRGTDYRFDYNWKYLMTRENN